MAKEIDVQVEVQKINQLLHSDSRFEDKEVEQMTTYAEMLLEKNQQMNLTAITEGTEFYIKHILDSLSLLSVIDSLTLEGDLNLLDIGSGAGLPGIPLKIMRDSIEICLLDSLKKRTVFLDDVIAKLNLNKISTLHARAEDAGQDPSHREHYKIVTARAVASLEVLLELAVPFVQVGGYFIAMKGLRDERHLGEKAAKILGVTFVEEKHFVLEGEEGERKLLIYKKLKETPKQYPRKAGTPNKKPLI